LLADALRLLSSAWTSWNDYFFWPDFDALDVDIDERAIVDQLGGFEVFPNRPDDE